MTAANDTYHTIEILGNRAARLAAERAAGQLGVEHEGEVARHRDGVQEHLEGGGRTRHIHAPRDPRMQLAEYTDMMYAEAALAKRKASLSQLAAQVPWRRRQLGGGRRPAVHLLALAAQPMEVVARHQRDRVPAQGVQAPDQCVLQSPMTACMLFWALLAFGQITLRRVDGWDSFRVKPDRQALELAD